MLNSRSTKSDVPYRPTVAASLVLSLAALLGHSSSSTWADEQHSVFGLQFSPDGKFLAATSNSMDPPGPVVLWNVDDWSIAAIHRPAAGSLEVDFSADGKRLAYGTKRGKVGILGVPSGELLGEFDAHSDAVFSVAFTPDGASLLSAGADHKIHLWNAITHELLADFNGHTDTVDAVAVSPDGKTLVSGGNDTVVRVWDLESRKVVKTFKPSRLIVRRVSFSRDGQHFLVSRWDAKVRIRETNTGRLRLRIPSGSDCADLTDDCRLVATTGHGSTAMVYAVELREATTEEMAEIDRLLGLFETGSYEQREAASKRIRELGMIAEPQLLKAMGAENAELRVRARTLREDVLSPEPIAELPGHAGDVEVVDFAPDGQLLATACRGGDIKIWDTSTFEQIKTLRIPPTRGARGED